MRRTIALLLVIVALFLTGIGYFFYVRGADAIDISLINEEGTVYVKENESAEYIKINAFEQTIASGSFVKTDAASYARVFLPDNSLISIDEKSEVQITYEGNVASIDQLIGKTWHRVQTVTNGGQYEVKTANTIAAVRGTIFAVGFDTDGTSHVSVEESKVDVKSIEIVDGEEKIIEEVTLEPGDRSDIPKNVREKIKKYLTDKAFKESTWYKRNKLVDQTYEELRKTGGLRNFRYVLKQKLEESEDFDRFKLGERTPVPPLVRLFTNNLLNQPDSKQIKEDLAPLYKLEKITENICSEMPPAELNALQDNLSKHREYVQDSDNLSNILNIIEEGCQEETLSVEAADKLKSLTQ